MLDKISFLKIFKNDLLSQIRLDQKSVNHMHSQFLYDPDSINQAQDFVNYKKTKFQLIDRILRKLTDEGVISTFDWETVLDTRYEFFESGEPDNFDVCAVNGDVPFHPR